MPSHPQRPFDGEPLREGGRCGGTSQSDAPTAVPGGSGRSAPHPERRDPRHESLTRRGSISGVVALAAGPAPHGDLMACCALDRFSQ